MYKLTDNLICRIWIDITLLGKELAICLERRAKVGL